MLCYRDDMALHPAGAWDQLCILREVLSAFGAAGPQASPERGKTSFALGGATLAGPPQVPGL